jgi:hypothetical protein
VRSGTLAKALVASAVVGASSALAAPVTWVDPAGLCAGQTPCFDTIGDLVSVRETVASGNGKGWLFASEEALPGIAAFTCVAIPLPRAATALSLAR